MLNNKVYQRKGSAIAKDMYYELLANKMHYIKTDEQEVGQMCEIIEKFAKEYADEVSISNALVLIKAGDITVERAVEVFKVSERDLMEALNAESSEPKN